MLPLLRHFGESFHRHSILDIPQRHRWNTADLLLTAFLSTLRTNIQLSTTDSIPPSPMVPPTIILRLPNPASTSFSIMTSYQPTQPAPTADPLPRLTTYTPDTNTEKLSALRLIADSVAQQRQQAVKAILANSYVMATLGLILALEAYWLNAFVLLTTGTGTIMSVLVGIRWLTGGYISAAEQINWDWLTDTTSPVSSSTSNHSHTYSNGHKRGRSATIEEPTLLVTKWGEEIIGALVIRVSKREKKGFVRAWTVARRYRGKGVGKALLEEGVKLVMGKSGVKGVEFDDEGACKSSQCPFLHVKLLCGFCIASTLVLLMTESEGSGCTASVLQKSILSPYCLLSFHSSLLTRLLFTRF